MSLINKMLQDLEQRSGQSSEGVLAGVRSVALPEDRVRSGRWLPVLVLLLLAVIGLLIWLLLQQSKPVPAISQAQPKVAPAVSPQPAAPTVAALSVPAEAVAPAPAPVMASPVSLPSPTLPPLPVIEPPAATGKPSPPQPAVLAGKPEPDKAEKRENEKKPAKVELAEKKPEPAAVAVKQISPQQQAEYLYQKAAALLQQGRVAEAQESLAEALRLAPTHIASRHVLAGILVENKQYAQAEQLLRDGLTQGASQPEFIIALARIQVERGDSRGALETLQKNLAGAKEHAGYQSFLATLLQRQGQHKLAIEHYLAALRLAPASAATLVGLGISLQAENRLAEAQEAYGRARSGGGLSPELQGFVDQRLKQIQQQLR